MQKPEGGSGKRPGEPMTQSLAKVIIHIIYSSKNRAPLHKAADLRSELFSYNATILRDQVDSPAIFIHGVADTASMLMNDMLGTDQPNRMQWEIPVRSTPVGVSFG